MAGQVVFGSFVMSRQSVPFEVVTLSLGLTFPVLYQEFPHPHLSDDCFID
ncbi:MAG: hypothetical protein F6K00_34005 [Leptolyngbya sp. SIOISBB]|nr:hypothetical protein [Leptolyngbya sp. SIOISBB]